MTVVPALGAVAPPPCRPPLELVELDGWVLEVYRQGERSGETIETFDSRLEAMRVANEVMNAEFHPCIVRWDDRDVVGGLYWNDAFERLDVSYDPFLQRWAITPESGAYLFQAAESQLQAAEYAQAIQQTYDFKHLRIRAADGGVEKEHDHRFLRQSLAESGVRFDPEAMAKAAETTPELLNEEPESTPERTESLLDVVEDFTELNPVETTRLLNYYRTAWTGSETARVVTLDPELEDEELEATFEAVAEQWEAVSDSSHIATVHGVGDSPSPWVAYEPGRRTLTEAARTLEFSERLQVVGDMARAVDALARYRPSAVGITPRAIQLESGTGRLAECGLRRQLRQTVGERQVTWYTAPEQLDGITRPQTGIYQLGALTYFLLWRGTPFEETTAEAVEAGITTTPSDLVDAPEGVDAVVERAMAKRPGERYERATVFYWELRDALIPSPSVGVP